MKLALIMLFVNSLGFTQSLKGMISLKPLMAPASDLVYQEQVLLPEKAFALSMDEGLDLSRLNPSSDSVIWSDLEDNRLSKSDDNLGLKGLEQLTFEQTLTSRSGNFRFSVIDQSSSTPSPYTFMLSKKIHNVLLRKNLLRKLGYQVPKIEYLNKIKINFKTKLDKKFFLASLKDETFASTSRWVLAQGDKYIIIQDLIAMKSDVHYYNFALGAVTEQIVRGRRLIRSLLVPFALTHVPESMNLFSWSAGRILANHIKLDYPLAAIFGTTIEDAKWIGRKIADLSSDEWSEIVEMSYFPKPVAIVLKEKLISRRNVLVQILGIDNEYELLEFDSSISFEDKVLNGEVIQERFDGYSSRFSYGDPESPLSNSEISNFARSKVITTLISNGVNQLNSLKFMATNHGEKFLDNLYQTIAQAMIFYNETGEPYKVPIRAFAYPSYSGGVILNRDIIAGSYLGTDNKVQLVDTIGVQLNVGGSLQVGGLPVNIQVAGRAGVNYTRTYAHIRPIVSIKKAIKYPFKNMLVPHFKKKLGKSLNRLYSKEYLESDDEGKDKIINEALDNLGSKLEIGESLIVTDSVSVAGSADITLGLSNPANLIENGMKAQLMGGAEKNVVSRLHIMRASKTSYHIYKDLGNVNRFFISARLNALLPILEIGSSRVKGKARIKFYKLDVNSSKISSTEKRDRLVNKIQALRMAFINGSLKKLKKVKKPYVIEHKLSEKIRNASLSILKYKKIKSFTDMKITHPLGHKKRLYKRYLSKTKGIDYEGLSSGVLTVLASMLTKQDIVIPYSNASNPGNSIFGKAKNKILSFESVINTEGESTSPFVKLSYVYNGWKIKKKKAANILKKMSQRYDFFFYPKTALNETKSIILYNINYNFIFYTRAIEHMLSIKDSKVKNIFKSYRSKMSLRDKKDIGSGLKRFLRLRSRFGNSKKINKYSNMILKMIDIAENKLNLEGILELAGGESNLYVYSKIEGFRNGDENGDRAYHSNSLGEFGAKEILGPIEAIRSKIGLTESEMMAYWIMSRAL